MGKSYKIIVACANGAGTSLMMKMTVEKVTKELGMTIQDIHHCSLAEAKSSAKNYDIAFVPLNFIEMFRSAEETGTLLIGLRNVLSTTEVKEKLQTANLE